MAQDASKPVPEPSWPQCWCHWAYMLKFFLIKFWFILKWIWNHFWSAVSQQNTYVPRLPDAASVIIQHVPAGADESRCRGESHRNKQNCGKSTSKVREMSPKLIWTINWENHGENFIVFCNVFRHEPSLNYVLENVAKLTRRSMEKPSNSSP